MEIDQLWPLIDTMVKVIIGGVIAAISVWLTARIAERKTGKPTVFLRKIEMLESVSAEVGNVNHIFAQYSALVIESIRFGQRWPAGRREELERVNRELVREFKKLADAEAKLLILGEKLTEKSLRFYGAKIARFRKEVYVGRDDITEEEIARIRQEIIQQREQFYDLLSRKYDRLLAA